MAQPFVESLAAFQAAVDKAIGEAVTASDYDSVQVLAELARSLRSTSSQLSARAGGGSPRPAALAMPSDSRNESVDSSTLYPQFMRDREDVVKIGWAAKSQSTYEHRAPFVEVTLFSQVVRDLSRSSSLFTAKQLRTAVDTKTATQERDPLPDSQFYVCLGWLKSIGALVQHGRRGYSIADTRMLGESLKTAFAVLPEIGSSSTEHGGA